MRDKLLVIMILGDLTLFVSLLIIIWLRGLIKPVERSLQKLADNMDQISQQKPPPFPERLKNKTFKLIPGGKK